MSHPLPIVFQSTDLESLAGLSGRIAVLTDTGALSPATRRLDRLTRGAVARAVASDAFTALKPGETLELAYPSGLACDALQLIRLPRRTDQQAARKAGGAVGRAHGTTQTSLIAENHPRAADLAFGLQLRAYEFNDHKTATRKIPGPVVLQVANPAAAKAAADAGQAVAEGVFFTRDLVNEPANILTTQEFSERLVALRDLGIDVEVLEDAAMTKLGMGALLGVGQGSESPSKLVVMRWNGGKKGDAPFALVGKGVVFDTGGISIKPASGMEDMTMDMGGAGVVAGVMKTLALRGAKANVVGLVGIVENMPDGRAQRPGDVVRSMKGDTIEVINTDAEGRLVLADVLWYAQERFNPSGVINLATLTGAIIVALGHENTGVFSNDDDLCGAFLKAAAAEGEGAWRMPMGQAYDDKLKSRVADMMNVGGRDGGAITAAQFIKRFIKDGMPWCHLDIAGTALLKADSALAPKGATGWGVMALDRLIRDRFEA